MDKFETNKYYEKYSVLKGIAYGAIAGAVAGFVMAPFLMASAAVIGLPANSILIVYGLAFGTSLDNAMTTGISLHLLTSAIVGMIFGSITSIVGRFRITGIGKGIAEGLVVGIIAFAALFVPFSMLVLPQFLAQINVVIETEPGVQQEESMDIIILRQEQAMPALIGLSIADHLIYGAVLGTVMSALAVRVRKKRGRNNARVSGNNNIPPSGGAHLKSDQQHICPKCQRQFTTEQELEEHSQRLHHYADGV